jgi:hypothetical protein
MSRRETRLGVGAVHAHTQTPTTEVRPKAPTREQEGVTTGDDEPPSGVSLRHERFTSVPRLALPLHDLMAMQLDHRAGFLISLVDGTYSLEMILDACAMKREEALAILADLAARGIIIID